MAALKDVISARLEMNKAADELRSFVATGKFYFTRNTFDELVAKQKRNIEEYARTRNNWISSHKMAS